MGFLDIHSEGMKADFERQLKNPGPAPAPDSFSTWSFLSAGAKGPVSGGLESAGTLADILSGFGTMLAATGATGQGMFSTGTDAEKKQAEQARQKMLSGDAFDTSAGNVLRRRADEWAPDPETSHKADQVLHGLTRGVSKAVSDIALLGPTAGATAFGVDEGNTAAQRLRMQGVDAATAAKVGGVTGVLSGVSVALPAVGSTVARTVGLAAAGGPASFMAQEKLAHDILQRAGYKDEASLHDPLDPLGLGLSVIIPGAIGGLHIRSLKKRASLADVVQQVESGGNRYGADGALLTSPKGAQGEMQVMPKTATDPGYGVTPAKDNSPEELARVGRDYLEAMRKKYGNDDQALAAYNAGPGAVDKAIKKGGENWLKELPQETRDYVAKANKLLDEHPAERASNDPDTVDAARVRVTEDALVKSLPDRAEARVEVLRAADEVAAGRMPDVVPVRDVELPEAATVSFTTAKGSTYEVGDGGVTIRNKAERLDIGHEGDFGVKPASEATYYISKEQAQALSEFQAQGGPRRAIAELPDGRIGIKYLEGDEAGKFERRTVVEPLREPQVGLLPVETWRDGSVAHFGNEIVEVRRSGAGVLRPSEAPVSSAQNATQHPPYREATNSLPPQGSVTLSAKAEPAQQAAPKPSDSNAKSPEMKRVDQLAKDMPDLLVKLPDSDETMTLSEALTKAREDAAYEANEADLVKAAFECAMGFGS